ncbi:TerD family protein [Agromyces humi]|uniref:TerD family protein n=1 Tax=Agromyces humi TaxID=1766800 RepID=UPI001356F40A|nr:TerD family protein [Agromyces humi]
MSTLTLTKNQSLSLTKQDGSALTKVTLGLGWDAAKRGGFFGGGGGNIDLDASAILLTADKQVVDVVSFSQLRSKDGSIRHTGDNLTGAGDGDDEQIVVDLPNVPANVDAIVLVVTSYQGQTFNKVANVFARVVDNTDARNTETVRYNLADTGNLTGTVIAKITRAGAGWQITALGTPANGRTAKDLIPAAKAA